MKVTQVSIGLPVYNASSDIRSVLDALLEQTFTDFELIISDDASTDGTSEVCEEFASRDKRIRYIKQPKNLGMMRNFQFVLDQASSEFFMWAASDDIRSNDFIEVNLKFLLRNPDFVASTSPVRFDNGPFDVRNMGDGSLTGDMHQRIAEMVRVFHANGRFYSLMRRAAIKGCPYIGHSFLGSDWAVVLYLVEQGKIHRASTGSIVLGSKGVSSGDLLSAFRKTWLDLFLPFNKLSCVVWRMSRGAPFKIQLSIACSLCMLNLKAFAGQFVTLLMRRRVKI